MEFILSIIHSYTPYESADNERIPVFVYTIRCGSYPTVEHSSVDEYRNMMVEEILKSVHFGKVRVPSWSKVMKTGQRIISKLSN